MRAMLLAVLCCVAIAVCGCQKATDVVTADELSVKSLKIVDSHGKLGAELGYSEHAHKDFGAVGFVLYDQNRKRRFVATIADDQEGVVFLALRRPDGTVRVGLSHGAGFANHIRFRTATHQEPPGRCKWSRPWPRIQRKGLVPRGRS